MAQRPFSPRDLRYLNSTGFEVYMASGAVFVLGFTASFIFSVVVNYEWLLWPGTFVTVLASYVVLKIMERREYRAKLNELEAEYRLTDTDE
ncbi:MAG: hypothetical protein MI924_02630 [Chloroflexales bacterium]|nr:hypothetical protein [Chloroflexales bacterium]